jgi:hypothetical protein
MSEYDNTNRGQIWANERKDKDTQPDYKGDINVDGVEYWVSAWKRKPDANPKAPSLSFAVTKKEKQSNQGGGGETPPQGDLDDEILFITPWPVQGIG